jgi:hypothetical protein
MPFLRSAGRSRKHVRNGWISRPSRQTALYSLGRLEEADEEYRAIEDLRRTAVHRADATAMQVTHRSLFWLDSHR